MPLHVGTYTHNLISSMLCGTAKAHALGCVREWRREMEAFHDDFAAEGIPVFWTKDSLAVQEQVLLGMVERWNGDCLDPMAVAIQGRVPLESPLTSRRHPVWDFGFEMDGIVRDTEGGDLWVWELKTTSLKDQSSFESYIEHDPQAWGYMWAASKIFKRPVGIVYDVLKKKPICADIALLKCRSAKCRKSLKDKSPHIADRPRFSLDRDSDFNPWSGGDHGEDSCAKCGGVGFIGVSTQSKSVSVMAARGAIRWMAKNGCEVAQQTETSYEWEVFTARLLLEESNMHYRIWRRPSEHYMSEFASNALQVAREIGSKKKKSKGDSDSSEWLRMRGSCSDFTGNTCSFVPICPTIHGDEHDLFERRDTSKPVELVEDNKTDHQRGFIPNYLTSDKGELDVI